MSFRYYSICAFLLALICCSGFSILMPLRIYIICIFLVVMLFVNIQSGRLLLSKKGLSFPILIFILYITIGILTSYDQIETFKYVVTFLSGSLMILLPNSDKFYEKSMQYIMMGCKFIALSIVVQLIIPNLYRDYLGFLIRGGGQRVSNELSQHIYSGIVGEKGEAAFLMVLGIILILSECAYKRRINRKEFMWLVIFYVALLLPAKRMLFVIAVLLTMMYLVFWGYGKRKIVGAGVAGMLLSIGYGIMLVIPSLNTLLNRFILFGEDDTFNGRTYLWEHAFKMFSERPLFGYGYGSYNKYASEQGVILTQNRNWESHAHNIYIQMCGEIGIIGLLLFAAINIFAIIIFFRINKTKERLGYPDFKMYFIGINIVLLVLIYGLTGNIIYYTNQIMVYLWGLSLLLHVYKSEKIV